MRHVIVPGVRSALTLLPLDPSAASTALGSSAPSGAVGRAERLGALVHALEQACDVLAFPGLDTCRSTKLEPSRDIAGRRSSVLRRLANPARRIIVVTTPEAAMERPSPRRKAGHRSALLSRWEVHSSDVADLWVPELNLPIPDLLPESYVQSDAVRLDIYSRIAKCRTRDELKRLEEETGRRFGRLPPEAATSSR
jgi:transcription-repair coupling factor (superfamily II helicase)